MNADGVAGELDWDDFLRKKLSNNGADTGEDAKGWIMPNPVEGISDLTPSGGKHPTFDRIIDGADSEYFNPKSTGNALREKLRKKFRACINQKKAERIYIDLRGKEGDLDDLIRSCIAGDATQIPALNELQIFYRVGEDLIQYTH